MPPADTPTDVPADSAGQPWAGKSIPSPGFAADVGDADPLLLESLYAAGRAPGADAESALLEQVAAARWLVPIVAMATEVTSSGASGGLDVDARSDMAAVTLTAPDGSRALPVFTSLAALAEWDPGARPVPVRAAAAAQSAVAEGCSVLVLDVASDHATVLRPSMVWALAQLRPWVPAHADPHVDSAVAAATRDERDIAAYRLEEGSPSGAGVLRVVLLARPGLDTAGVSALATRVGERLAKDGETRARIDSLTFSLEAVD